VKVFDLIGFVRAGYFLLELIQYSSNQ